MIKYSLYFIFFLITFLSLSLGAEQRLVEDSYIFSLMNETGDQACAGAEQKVKRKAIREVVGETISEKAIEICEGTDNIDVCKLHEITFHTLGKAKITYWKELQRGPVIPALNKEGFWKCPYKARVEVKKIRKKFPGFDFKLNLNGNYFKAHSIKYKKTNEDGLAEETIISKQNDTLVISIKPQEDMYITVFQWSPNINFNKFEKIFPNKLDLINFIKRNNEFYIPSKNALEEYNLRFWFPENTQSKTVQEHLWVIGTNKEINFDNIYTWIDFNKKIIELSESSVKYREKKDFYVIRKIDLDT